MQNTSTFTSACVCFGISCMCSVRLTEWPVMTHHTCISTHAHSRSLGSCGDASLSYWLTGVFHKNRWCLSQKLFLCNSTFYSPWLIACVCYTCKFSSDTGRWRSCGWSEKVCSALTELVYLLWLVLTHQCTTVWVVCSRCHFDPHVFSLSIKNIVVMRC